MGYKVTKGGRGPVGSHVVAPGGKFVHARKATPVKGAKYITVTRGGKKVRLMKPPGSSSFKVQSVLSKR